MVVEQVNFSEISNSDDTKRLSPYTKLVASLFSKAVLKL